MSMEFQSAKKWILRQFSTKAIIDLKLQQTDVGRDNLSTICLKWVFVSPRHAAFVVNCYGNLLVRDLNSATGTFVNSKLLEICVNKPLSNGDVVSFGMAFLKHATNDVMKTCFFEVLAFEELPTMHISTEVVATGSHTQGKDLNNNPDKIAVAHIKPRLSTNIFHISNNSKSKDSFENTRPVAKETTRTSSNQNSSDLNKIKSNRTSFEDSSDSEDFTWVDDLLLIIDGDIDKNNNTILNNKTVQPSTSKGHNTTTSSNNINQISRKGNNNEKYNSESKCIQEKSNNAKSPTNKCKSIILIEPQPCTSGVKRNTLKNSSVQMNYKSTKTNGAHQWKIDKVEKEHIKELRRKKLEELTIRNNAAKLSQETKKSPRNESIIKLINNDIYDFEDNDKI